MERAISMDPASRREKQGWSREKMFCVRVGPETPWVLWWIIQDFLVNSRITWFLPWNPWIVECDPTVYPSVGTAVFYCINKIKEIKERVLPVWELWGLPGMANKYHFLSLAHWTTGSNQPQPQSWWLALTLGAEEFPFLSFCPLCALGGTLFPLVRVVNWLQAVSHLCRTQLLQVLVQDWPNSLEEALIGMEGGGVGENQGKVFHSYVSEYPNSNPNGNPPFWGIHTAPGKQLMSSLPVSFLSRALRDSTVPFHKICRW